MSSEAELKKFPGFRGKPGHWSADMIRVVLQYISINKPLKFNDRKESPRILTEIQATIRNRVAEHLRNDFDESKIRIKIRDLPLKPRVKKDELWKSGPSCVNFDQLADDILTAEEYEAWQEGHDPFNSVRISDNDDSDDDEECGDDDRAAGQEHQQNGTTANVDATSTQPLHINDQRGTRTETTPARSSEPSPPAPSARVTLKLAKPQQGEKRSRAETFNRDQSASSATSEDSDYDPDDDSGEEGDEEEPDPKRRKANADKVEKSHRQAQVSSPTEASNSASRPQGNKHIQTKANAPQTETANREVPQITAKNPEQFAPPATKAAARVTPQVAERDNPRAIGQGIPQDTATGRLLVAATVAHQPAATPTCFALPVTETRSPTPARAPAKAAAPAETLSLADELSTMVENNVLMPNTIPKDLADKIVAITEKIRKTVSDRIKDSGLALNTVITTAQPDLANLSDLIQMICGGVHYKSGLEKVTTMYPQSPLELGIFVTAIVGAAVASWCLSPSLCADQEDGLLGMLMRQIAVQAPNAGPILLHQARCFYLDSIRDDLERHAEAMQETLSGLLLPLLTVPSSGRSAQLSNMCRVVQAPSSSSRPMPTPIWKINWDKELFEVFRDALKLRVIMDKSGGKYTFDFPRPGSIQTLLNDHDEILASEVTVLIALFPEIDGRFQTTHGGPFGAANIITPAKIEAILPFLSDESQTALSVDELIESSQRVDGRSIWT